MSQCSVARPSALPARLVRHVGVKQRVLVDADRTGVAQLDHQLRLYKCQLSCLVVVVGGVAR